MQRNACIVLQKAVNFRYKPGVCNSPVKEAASVTEQRQKAANPRKIARRSRRTGYAQIDERLLALLEALVEEVRATRESEFEQIDWKNLKVGGTD